MLKLRLTNRDKVVRAFRVARSRYGALADKREGVFIGAKAMGLSGQGVDSLGALLQRKGHRVLHNGYDGVVWVGPTSADRVAIDSDLVQTTGEEGGGKFVPISGEGG